MSLWHYRTSGHWQCCSWCWCKRRRGATTASKHLYIEINFSCMSLWQFHRCIYIHHSAFEFVMLHTLLWTPTTATYLFGTCHLGHPCILSATANIWNLTTVNAPYVFISAVLGMPHTHYSKMFGYVVASPFSPSSLFSPNFLLATLPGSQGPAPAQPGRKGQGKTARPKRATHPPADLHGKRAEAAGALDGIEVKDEESSDGWHEVKPKGRKQKK